MLIPVEDHLIDQVKAIFGSKLRAVDSLPGDWDADMLRKLILSAPAVYLAFTGGPRIANDTTMVGIDGRWSFFVITAHASGNAARRRGDSRQIGAYEIITGLTGLDGHVVPDVGTLDLVRVENLYSGTIDKQGVSLYAVLFNLPMNFDTAAPVAALDDFETFHADWDLAPADGVIDAQSEATLEQS